VNSLTIKAKLALAFGLVVSLFAVVIAITVHNLNRMEEATADTTRTYRVIEDVQTMRRGYANMESGVRGFALTGQPSYLEQFDAGRERFSRGVTDLLEMTENHPQQLERGRNLRQLQQSWIESFAEPTIALRERVNDGFELFQSMEALARTGRGTEIMEQMRALSEEIIVEERDRVATRAAEMESRQQQTFYILVGSAVAGGLLAAMLAMYIAGNIGRRLDGAIEVAEATANGDLTLRVDTTGKDEIAGLMRAIAGMQSNLRDMLGRVGAGAEQLAGAAEQLSATAESLEEASSQQSESSSSMAAAVEQLTVSINQVSDGASEASSIAQESGRVSEEGSEVLDRTVKSIRQIAEKVTITSKDIEALNERSGEISSIINVIKEIAEQTNLLALNAAIEAARAGDQGRGFAVVADEVRKLAERTSVSTQEISDMIEQIQEGTGRAVTAMRDSIKHVDEGVELAGDAGDVIDRIAQGAREVVRHARSISDALKEQSVASNEVSGNVERIAQMAEENNGSVRETTQTARSLRELGGELKGAMSRFKLV